MDVGKSGAGGIARLSASLMGASLHGVRRIGEL